MSVITLASGARYDREDILAAIGEPEFVELLERYGCRVRGLRSRCPIHGGDNERALHFSECDGAVLFNCFSVGCWGDAIGFVMKVERCDLLEAVSLLADQFHVTPRMPGQRFPSREVTRVRAAPDPAEVTERLARMERLLLALARRSPSEENYLQCRGIAFREGLCFFNVGSTGDAEADRLAARGYRIALPLYDPKTGALVSFQFRRATDACDERPRVMTLAGLLNGAVFGSVANDMKPNEPLFVTEGLIDTLAALSASPVRAGETNGESKYLRVVGFPGATSAHRLREGFGAQLCGRDVLIALDGDTAGEKAASELALDLATAGAKPYRLRTAEKDLADELRRGSEAGEGAEEVLFRLFRSAIRADEYGQLGTLPTPVDERTALPTASPLRSFTLAQLRARPKKISELIVAPFMGRHESAFFYGPKGNGKTWAAMGSAIVGAQGNGARFLNFHAAGPGVPTLYVDAEMFELDVRQRAEDICRTAKLDPADNLFFWTPDAQPDGTPILNLLEESGRRMLDDHIDDICGQTGKAIEQIYFDNLSTLLHGWVEKDSDSWDPLLQWTLQLRARQIGNAWVHHSNRAGGYRGSSAIVTTMHSILKIAHPDGYRADMGANFDLTYEYTRAKPESGLYDVNARLEGDVWTVKESGPNHDGLIRILFGQGLTLRAIAAQIEGMSKSSVERAVKRLGLQK